MNTGLLYNATNTIDTYVYRGLLETNDVGRASAAGFIQSVLGFLLVLGSNYAVRAIEKEQALF
jgi:putative aldouronate transport system permease protein